MLGADFFVFLQTRNETINTMLGLDAVGRYALLMKRTFSRPDNWKMFWRQLLREIIKLGYDSIFLILIISVFMGVIMTMQVVLNTENPLLPRYTTGLMLRDTYLLEFSSTIVTPVFLTDQPDCKLAVGRQSGVEHCFGNRFDARVRTDRCARDNGRQFG